MNNFRIIGLRILKGCDHHIYNKMHYSNKEFVINDILKDYRGIINGIIG